MQLYLLALAVTCSIGSVVTQQCTRLCTPPTRCVVTNEGYQVCKDSCSPNRCGRGEQCVYTDCSLSTDTCIEQVYCYPLPPRDDYPVPEPSTDTPSVDDVKTPDPITSPSPSLPTNSLVKCTANRHDPTFCKPFQDCVREGLEYYCVDNCDPRRCLPTQVCSLQIVTCKTLPCLPVAVCMDI